MQELYKWIDTIDLSRPKRNISRDFSDGVLVAEVVKNFIPRMVDLHNYQPASSQAQKMANWKTLNQKVLKKLDLNVPQNVMQGVVMMKPGVIEVVLNNLRLKLQQYLSPARAESSESQYDNNEELDYTPSRDHRHNGANRRDRERDVYKDRERRERDRDRDRSRGMGSDRRDNGRDHMRLPEISPDGRVGRNRRGVGSKKHITKARPSPRELDLLVTEKEQQLREAQDTIETLQMKVDKLMQLVHLKDRRISDLQRALNEN